MAGNVGTICDTLERCQLLSSADMAALRTKWFAPQRKDADDPAKFAHWLVVNRYATDFVVQAIRHGKGDHLVFKQYRVHDQIKSGPMAGALMATDPRNHKVAIEVLAQDTDEATARWASFTSSKKRPRCAIRMLPARSR